VAGEEGDANRREKKASGAPCTAYFTATRLQKWGRAEEEWLARGLGAHQGWELAHPPAEGVATFMQCMHFHCKCCTHHISQIINSIASSHRGASPAPSVALSAARRAARRRASVISERSARRRPPRP
jgi:hypothetical protein